MHADPTYESYSRNQLGGGAPFLFRLACDEIVNEAIGFDAKFHVEDALWDKVDFALWEPMMAIRMTIGGAVCQSQTRLS